MKKEKPFNLILLGDPAAGKATQAARLVKRYGLYDLDMGRELRSPKMQKTISYAVTAGKGMLTPTRFVRQIFERVIRVTPKTQGILFDGTPKMVGEAKFVARLLGKYKRQNPLVIYLSIPLRETLERAGRRREYVGRKLAKREDDTDRGIKNRLKYYRTQIRRVVSFFKKHYTFTTISGMGTRDQIARRILSWLKPRI
ncbi:nucleoside monophosphate kinase [Candidatus Parcubacteria bacterium]|nr:MAG: nucleoside monophosphate kinase [Candidatus Parcubacteria bacterium]